MNKRGQSIIEYALLAVLIVLGIVVMGPYVLRSVGAHFQIWGESVTDSTHESLNQAPVNDIPYIPTNCVCQPDRSSGCGSNNTVASQCAGNQSTWIHSCTPIGCDGQPDSYCKDDQNCCNDWSKIGCGSVPIGQPATSTNCNYGYVISGHQCGSDTTIQCTQDASCAMPACQGVLSPGAEYCATGSTVKPVGLDQDYPLNYVASQANCPSVAHCQVYCVPPYKLNKTKTACTAIFAVAPALFACPDPPTAGCICTPSTNGTILGRFNTQFIYKNDCGFQMCAAPTTLIKGASMYAVSGTSATACTDPNAQPGAMCTVVFDY